MSEFVEFPVEQSFGEVISDAYERARAFMGEVLARAEILPIDMVQAEPTTVEPLFAEQSQQSQQGQNGQGQQPQPHICGASCSKCGHGGTQVRKPGLRR